MVLLGLATGVGPEAVAGVAVAESGLVSEAVTASTGSGFLRSYTNKKVNKKAHVKSKSSTSIIYLPQRLSHLAALHLQISCC